MLSTLQTHSGGRSLPQRTCSSNRDMGEAKSFMQGSEESAGSIGSPTARGSSSMLLFHWHDERNNCRKENLEYGKKKIKTHDVMSRSSKSTKLVHWEIQICLKFNNAPGLDCSVTHCLVSFNGASLQVICLFFFFSWGKTVAHRTEDIVQHHIRHKMFNLCAADEK